MFWQPTIMDAETFCLFDTFHLFNHYLHPCGQHANLDIVGAVGQALESQRCAGGCGAGGECVAAVVVERHRVAGSPLDDDVVAIGINCNVCRTSRYTAIKLLDIGKAAPAICSLVVSHFSARNIYWNVGRHIIKRP